MRCVNLARRWQVVSCNCELLQDLKHSGMHRLKLDFYLVSASPPSDLQKVGCGTLVDHR